MKNQNDKLFRLVLMRHEQPYYKDVGHDLTLDGVERSKSIGKSLKEEGVIDVTREVHLFHSPKPRAKGTLEFVVEGGALLGNYTEIADINSSEFADIETFLQREKELGLSLEDVAREHYENKGLYEESPHIVEPHTKRRARFYKFLSELIYRYIVAESSIKQIVAVSHFEIIMHIVDDVFDIKTFPTYMAPALGEYVVMDFFLSNKSGCVDMELYFRDRKEQVMYNPILRKLIR